MNLNDYPQFIQFAADNDGYWTWRQIDGTGAVLNTSDTFPDFGSAAENMLLTLSPTLSATIAAALPEKANKTRVPRIRRASRTPR